MNKYSEPLQKIFRDNRWSTATCFFEFFGPSSFAGVHIEDEVQDVVLFDVSAEKRGMLEPREFIRTFGDLDIAKVLYHGNPTDEFVTSVRNGSLSGMTLRVSCVRARMLVHDYHSCLRSRMKHGSKK